jgi:hypothetical protein
MANFVPNFIDDPFKIFGVLHLRSHQLHLAPQTIPNVLAGFTSRCLMSGECRDAHLFVVRERAPEKGLYSLPCRQG